MATQVSNSQLKPGDVSVDAVTLYTAEGVGHNILAQVISINLYESIFSFMVSGEMIVEDALAIREYMKMSGKEFVRIVISTPSLSEPKIERDFFIHSISDKYQLTATQEAYFLKFMSKESLEDSNARISRTLKGSPSDMIRSILAEDLHSKDSVEEISPAGNTFAFISNFWQPSVCFRYIQDHALSKENRPDMLLWQSLTGGFKFKSISEIMDPKREPDMLWSKNIQAYSQANGEQTADFSNLAAYMGYENISEHSGFDYFARKNSGYYGGTMVGFDALTQQYFYKRNSREFDADLHANKHTPLPKYAESNDASTLYYQTKHFNLFEDYKDVTDFDVKLQRRMIFSRYETTRLNLRVKGCVAFFAGMKARVLIPLNVQKTDKTDELNKISSGDYIVSYLKHEIDVRGHSHICQVEAMKDSFVQSMDFEDLNADSAAVAYNANMDKTSTIDTTPKTTATTTISASAATGSSNVGGVPDSKSQTPELLKGIERDAGNFKYQYLDQYKNSDEWTPPFKKMRYTQKPIPPDILAGLQGPLTPSTKLSEHLCLADFKFDINKLGAYNGSLTRFDVLQNMAFMAINCLEPLGNAMPNGWAGFRKSWFITSGLRMVGGPHSPGMAGDKSQHCKGEAVDIGFGTNVREHFIRACMAAELTDYDQLLFERRTADCPANRRGREQVWIHISYSRQKGQNQRMLPVSMVNDHCIGHKGNRIGVGKLMIAKF